MTRTATRFTKNSNPGTRTCADCGRRTWASNIDPSTGLCLRGNAATGDSGAGELAGVSCYDKADEENSHTDGYHADTPSPWCPTCQAEKNLAKSIAESALPAMSSEDRLRQDRLRSDEAEESAHARGRHAETPSPWCPECKKFIAGNTPATGIGGGLIFAETMRDIIGNAQDAERERVRAFVVCPMCNRNQSFVSSLIAHLAQEHL